jgi:hypothetical protein
LPAKAEKLNLADLRFWDVENDYCKIDGIYFSSFHGGNTLDWVQTTDSYIQFDEIVAAKKRVGL